MRPPGQTDSTIRRATLADVAALVGVINRAYRVEAHLFRDERTDEADVRERVGRANACFLVIDAAAEGAGSDGRLVGAVYVETRRDRGYFGMLAVDPDRQGRGLGRRLVAAAEAHCRAAGCRCMDIDVVDLRTELPGFYESLGYAAVSATPFADTSRVYQPVNLVLMTKALEES